jgi:membrane-associated phospholipid phosphatase
VRGLVRWTALYLICAIAANAQEPPLARTLFTNFLHDQKAIWTSPGRLKRSQAAGVILFATVTAALIATDRRTSNALPNTPDQIRISSDFSRIGSAYTVIPVAGGLLAAGKLWGNDHLAETGFLGLEALADSLAVASAIKLATSRERPGTGSGDGHFFSGNGMSFPSGHSIMSWSLAEVIASQYHDRPLVRIGAYSLAAIATLSRLPARKHFPSDAFAGAAGGLLIGHYVWRTHHDPARGWSAMPVASVRLDPRTRTYGLALAWGKQ